MSSQLSTIFLLALVYADGRKKENSLMEVLTPFVHEMKKLSSEGGVEIDVDGELFILRAVLVALTADTPAAHDVLGFIAPQGANHFVWSADLRSEQMQMLLEHREQKKCATITFKKL